MVLKFWGIFAVVLLTAGCQTTHQGAGSGNITLSTSVESRFQGYLANPTASYFAVSTDGQSFGYSICSAGRGECTESAGTVALRSCHRKSKGVPCKIYAMNETIVWQGVAETGTRKTEIKTPVGRGPITMTSGVESTFEKYLAKDDPEYFAVSVNGSSAGYTFCNNTPCLSPGLRARSVFRCEASSRKKGHNSPCYVYAVKRKIVWENYKTVKTPVRLGNEQKPIAAGKILKRDKAKKDCEELGFQPKTPGFGKCVLQLIQ